VAVSNASLGNLFLTIKADTKGALGDIQRVIREAEKAAKAVDELNKKAGRVQAPRTPPAPAAPRTPTAPRSPSGTTGGGSRGSQKQLSDLDKVGQKLKALQETSRNIGKSNDAVSAELASDSVLNRVKKLRAELNGLLPSLKTNDEKVKVQALLAELENVNKQTRAARRVAKFQPEKVAEAGSVGAAVKAVQQEEDAARKARQQARLKGIADAKKYLDDLRKAQAKADADAKKAADKAAADAKKVADKAAADAKKAADKAAADAQKAADKAAEAAKKLRDKATADAQKAADKAARDAKRLADKSAREAQRAADKAARDTQRAAEKAARETQRAADKAAKTASREAAKAAKDAEKLAAKTAAKAKSGISGLTTGLFSNLGKGAAKSVADFSAAAAALRYGNVFGGLASGARAVTGLFTNASKTVGEFGTAVEEAGSAAGPLGVVLAGVVVAGLVAASTWAAKAIVSFAGFAAQAALVGTTLKALFTTGFTGASELEKSSLTLEAVLGARAKSEQDYLIKRDRASLYDFTGLQELDRTLLAFNVTNDQTRQGLVDTLVTLGTVGGRSIEQLQFAARALGQISANGTPLRQDILQLVQSLGVSEKVLQSLPEYAGKSTSELRKMLEQGLIPSTTFFKALGLYAEQFGPIAAKAAGTFEGQVNNIKDTLKTGLSKAFLDTGVLAAAADLASKVLAVLSTINFNPIGEGFRAVVQGIQRGLGGLVEPGSGGDTIKNFFEQTLPKALYGIAGIAQVVAGLIGQVFGGWISGMAKATGQNKSFAMAAVGILNGFVKIAIAVANVVKFAKLSFILGKAIIGVFVNLAKTLGNIGKILFDIVTGKWGKIGKDASQIGKDWSNYNEEISKGIADTENSYTTFVDNINNLADQAAAALNAPAFQPQDPKGPGVPDQQSGPDNAAADELKKKIDDLRNQLYDLTRRIYGLRSELERGLLGDVGFQATKEQIAQMGDQVAEIMRGLGRSDIAAAIDRQAQQLMRLADVRDAVAKQLEDANKRLEDAIKARDDFAEQIRKQAVDFVNALALEEKTVDKIRTFKVGGITGYLVSQVKESQKYVDVLRKRLNTFRDFQTKTKRLAERGLDKGVLEQLVAAGPEQAGTIVDQLASSGDDVIKEVNSIQKELGQVAKDAGQTQAANFYQAGVDQARAQATGLLSQIAYISSVAEMLGQAIYNAVVPFAQKTGDAIATAVSTPVANRSGGGSSRPPAAPQPKPPAAPPAAPAPNPLAVLLLTAQKQINDSVMFINARTQQMTNSWTYSYEQIQNERKFLFTDLVKRYSDLVKVPDSTGYNISVYLGGQKIGEYVDIALRDKYGRTAAGSRQGVGQTPAKGSYPGGFMPAPTFVPNFGRS
jgi:tape measure domain-containing protein